MSRVDYGAMALQLGLSPGEALQMLPGEVFDLWDLTHKRKDDD